MGKKNINPFIINYFFDEKYYTPIYVVWTLTPQSLTLSTYVLIIIGVYKTFDLFIHGCD